MEFISKLVLTLDVYGWIGIVGSLLVCLCYFLGVHKPEKYAPTTNKMLLTNLFAALLLSVSLFVHPNPGSILIEIFWTSVAIYGLVINLKKHFTAK